MTMEELKQKLEQYVSESPENAIESKYALNPELTGIPYYDLPLLGCASANDPIFNQFKTDPRICGPLFRTPDEWLSGAESVISLFLPYTEEIRASNTPDLNTPSAEWLHARVEGHAFLSGVCRLIAAWLEDAGYRAVIPAVQADFRIDCDPLRRERGEPVFSSSWSERHAAFAAGLGTFGLSKHIITEKGVCGRFGSVITDAPLAPTPRPYTEPYEYCTFCGACCRRCPVDAISLKDGKDVLLCSNFVDGTKALFAPRYGCGKCQLSVPCEAGIPGK